MSSTKAQLNLPSESVHDVWLRQRLELERELFDGLVPDHRPTSAMPNASRPTPATPVATGEASPRNDGRTSGTFPQRPHAATDPQLLEQPQHAARLTQANEIAARQRAEHQQRVADALAQQREAFVQDLARQRAAFEQELASREAAWAAQRDQEWAALRTAQEVQAAAEQQLKEELAAQRVREREELLQWRRQAEAELAEARRFFEQERLQQQQEFARQREAEMERLRREREDFDARMRQAHAELAMARQRQDEELRQARECHLAQMRAERAELDKLRETWLEKFRREQVVLENGLKFFEQHVSRVSEELRLVQRGLQAVSESATEANPMSPLIVPAPARVEHTPEPTILSLDEIRERLLALKQTCRESA